MNRFGGWIPWRLFGIALLAGAGATLVQNAVPDYALFSEVGIWIYALLVAFLIDKALLRRTELKENINIELARLRHVRHIGEQLGATSSKRIDRHLETYQQALGNGFRSYAEAHHEFRALSHEIYRYNPKTQKQNLLYADLLETLQDLTLGRQHIQYAIGHRLGGYYWFLILLVLAGLFVLLFFPAALATPLSTFGIAWITIFISLIPLEMLWKSDRYSDHDIAKYQDLYLDNTPRALKQAER